MSKITIIEGNSNDKDNVRAYMVKGEKGEKGDPNTLSIGKVEETETAQATITGDAPNQILNLGLPKATPNSLRVGGVEPSNVAYANITGDAPNQVLYLGLPKGDKGDQGAPGFEVPQGAIIGFDTEIEVPEGYMEIDGFENYSTTEQKIGTWVDGKPLYKKSFNFGNLPNTDLKAVALNINNLKYVVKLEGYMYGTGLCALLPYASSSQTYNIDYYIEGTSINIQTYRDRSNQLAWGTVYYTKTTD